MKFKVINEFDNPLLKRIQINVEIDGLKATPKRVDIIKEFSAKMGYDPKLVIVDTIFNRADTNKVQAYIKVYKDENTLKKVEVKNNIEKWKKVLDILYPKEEKKENEKEKSE